MKQTDNSRLKALFKLMETETDQYGPLLKQALASAIKANPDEVQRTLEEEFASLMKIVRNLAGQITKNLHANGCNVLINTKEAAGQTVMHTHVHIIPRYDANDTIEISFKENKLDLSEVLKEIKG